MNADEVVIREVEFDRILEVLQFLAESVREASKESHVHPHREVYDAQWRTWKAETYRAHRSRRSS